MRAQVRLFHNRKSALRQSIFPPIKRLFETELCLARDSPVLQHSGIQEGKKVFAKTFLPSCGSGYGIWEFRTTRGLFNVYFDFRY